MPSGEGKELMLILAVDVSFLITSRNLPAQEGKWHRENNIQLVQYVRRGETFGFGFAVSCGPVVSGHQFPSQPVRYKWCSTCAVAISRYPVDVTQLGKWARASRVVSAHSDR